jgi:predicted kinase
VASLGAGKTTFAAALARQLGAVRFSVDELYLKLFADGPTYELDQPSLDRLFLALEGLWPQVLQAGADVVEPPGPDENFELIDTESSGRLGSPV